MQALDYKVNRPQTSNHLLLKDEVGRSKPSTRDLPSSDFTYGKSAGFDAEGARAVTSSWREHKPSSRGVPRRDFKKLNSMSVTQGCFTAKHASLFRTTTDFKVKLDNIGKLNKAPPKLNEDMTFGMPDRPSTPINAVVGNLYGRVAAEIKAEDYSQPVVEKKIGRPRLTKAYSYLATAVRASLEPNTKQEFKLKKFQAVTSRTNTHNARRKSLGAV
jgi:hypothetical protein